MSEELDELPPVLAAIAEAAGLDAALAIARQHGGTRVKVPTLATGTNWLTSLVGHQAAAAIIETLGPARAIDVPLGPEGLKGGYYHMSRTTFARRIQELEERGATAPQIARALGVTERAVRMRRAARRQRAMGDLFD